MRWYYINGDTLINMARDNETAIAAWHCMAGDLSLNISAMPIYSRSDMANLIAAVLLL